MKVSRGRQAELSLDLAGQQGQGSLCMRGPAPQSSQLYQREPNLLAKDQRAHVYPAQVGSQVHAATCTPRIHINRTKISTKIMDLYGTSKPQNQRGKKPNWEPKMSKGSKENEGSEGDHFQKSPERARAPPPPFTEHPNALCLQT